MKYSRHTSLYGVQVAFYEIGQSCPKIDSLLIGPPLCLEQVISRESYQKGPTRHAYAWQIGPYWQDTLDILTGVNSDYPGTREGSWLIGTGKTCEIQNTAHPIYNSIDIQMIWIKPYKTEYKPYYSMVMISRCICYPISVYIIIGHLLSYPYIHYSLCNGMHFNYPSIRVIGSCL